MLSAILRKSLTTRVAHSVARNARSFAAVAPEVSIFIWRNLTIVYAFRFPGALT